MSVALARRLAEVSGAIRRRVGLLLDRRGRVVAVSVGTADRLWIPEFGRVRAGVGRLRGLRWITTSINGEGLTRDDLNDLVRLRLDCSVALDLAPEGGVATLRLAHVAPFTDGGPPHALREPVPFASFDDDFLEFVAELERGLARALPAARAVTSEDAPRTVIAHVALPGERDTEVRMHELRELTRTAGLHVVAEEVQRRRSPDPRFVLGSGRLSELIVRALQLEAELLVFGRDLTPAQLRAVSDATELKVIDRTQLILDIFAQHARTRDGKLQVELAQLRYRLPRLQGRHNALSRLAGGIGGRGPGETRLEVDRRRVKDRIALLDKRINDLARQRALRRQRRHRRDVPVVAIVGYTNAGKSTLLNALTGAKVIAEDKLFATLDPTTRRLRFPEEREIVLTDTVGFIRDLPPDLMRAFRATLEELSDADLLLHVADISEPGVEARVALVEETLRDLDLGRVPRLLVLNKIDRPHEAALRERFEARQGAVSVAARARPSLAPLVGRIGARLFARAPAPESRAEDQAAGRPPG